MNESGKTPMVSRKMAFAFIIMLALIWAGFGTVAALNIVFIITAIVMNALVTIEAWNWFKTGTKFDKKYWIYAWVAVVLDGVAFIVLGNLTLILASGVGVPLLIHVFIAIEDKVRGK